MTQEKYEKDFNDWVDSPAGVTSPYYLDDIRRAFFAGLEAGRKPTGHVERGWAILKNGQFKGVYPKFTQKEFLDEAYGEDNIVPVEIREVNDENQK
jgi:hypothetical protein